MTETFFGFVSGYGLPVIFITAFLSCLAVPIPTFAVMLAGGAFAASGDLVLWQVFAVAFLAAVLGDQSGFYAGRLGGPSVIARLERSPERKRAISRARRVIHRWGGVGVFFSTWLFAPLGPWMNLIAGAAGMSRWTFLAWDAAGEAIWVTVYVSLGYVFGARLGQLTDIVGDWAGLISSAGASLVLGILLVRTIYRHRRAG